MQPMTSRARPLGTINRRGIRGLVAAGLLCAALAGSGAAAALAGGGAAAAAATPSGLGAGGAPLAAGAAQATGCASVHQATSAVVTRYLVVPVPVSGGTRTYTQRHATLVRALFASFCAALAHGGRPQPAALCAAHKGGSSFSGTFYGGRRILATFTYSERTCPLLVLTAAGKTRAAVVIGKVAAAAPHLKADLAAVLGIPVSQV